MVRNDLRVHTITERLSVPPLYRPSAPLDIPGRSAPLPPAHVAFVPRALRTQLPVSSGERGSQMTLQQRA